MAIQTRLEDMVIGDKIRSLFKYKNGSLDPNNHFTNLGEDNFSLGSPYSFATESSTGFQFIYVGNDFKGRMILVADRNVTHSISWDQLNTMGYATKDGVQITSLGLDPAQWKTNIRLLTGGVSDALKANSEWDKYIVNGPYPGDNATWNWSGIYSWTSTTSNVSAQRIERGRSSAIYWTADGTTGNNTTKGFRPVLVAESLAQPIQNKYLIQDNLEIKKYSGTAWQSIGPAPATKEMFDAYGSDISDLSPFQRAEKEMNTLLAGPVTEGSGRIFSHSMNLQKLKRISKIRIQ